MRCCHPENKQIHWMLQSEAESFSGKALKRWCQPEETVEGGRGTEKKVGDDGNP
jgi:hypothetical protein